MARASRGKGEGSVYLRTDGRWIAQVEAGRDASGRRRYARAVRLTKAAAIRALRELQGQVDAELVTDRTMTVSTYLDWWADNVLAGSVKESTEADYRGLLNRSVKPYIGRRRLDKLTTDDVQAMMRALERRGLSPRSRQYARAVLVRALRWAHQTGRVTRNVAALADGPRLGRAAKLDDVLDATAASRVLVTARCDRLEALAIIVLRLGLRRGEALALRWGGVDLDAGELTVAGTLKARRGGELYVDTPKTAAGERTIPLVGGTAEALGEHRRRQTAERLAAGPLWRDSGHVFTHENGQPLRPARASSWWKALCVRAGIGPRRFHASRHTAATLMLEDGVPLEVVSAILGHAGLAITADVYARVSQDSKRRALARLDATIKAAR